MHPFEEHVKKKKKKKRTLHCRLFQSHVAKRERHVASRTVLRGLPLRRVTKEKFDSEELFTARAGKQMRPPRGVKKGAYTHEPGKKEISENRARAFPSPKSAKSSQKKKKRKKMRS